MWQFINLVKIFVIAFINSPLLVFKPSSALYNFLKFSGPSFLKFGQVLSTRPDLVGENSAKILSSFQDKVPPFSQQKVLQILNQEFSNPIKTIFSEFNFTPVASASIAQVHKAKLINGKIVAVKILRPDIEKRMSLDIQSLKLLISFLKPFSKRISQAFEDIYQLLLKTSKSELNLLNEAANATKIKENLKELKGFYIPEIYWQFSTKNILVLEWIEGTPFSNVEMLRNSGFNNEEIAKNLVISYFNQVYVHGLFHADMHPGNLILMKNGDIAAVDFGIVGTLDKKTRLAVAEILIGFLHKNYRRVAILHIESGFVSPETKVEDLEISCRKIGQMIVGSDVKDISFAQLLKSLIEMTNEFKMKTDPDLLLLQKTLMLVEGVGVSLNPNLNMWDLARPWVKEWAKQNISFDAKIRDAALEIFEFAKKTIRKIAL